MNKVVTIIISAYNKAEYLEHCCRSLFGTNIDKAEIIIVNDGSTDETSQVAHKLSKSCGSVVVIDKDNAHQGSCVNAAMNIATGKYVKMLDADDFFDTKVFDDYIDVLESTSADMVITGHVVGADGRTISPLNVELRKVLLLDDVDFRKKGLAECLGMHGVTYKTAIFRQQNIRLTEKCSFTDAEFCYYPIKHCRTVLFMNDVLYHYQTNVEGQESSLKTAKVKDNAFLVCNKMLGDYEADIFRGGNSAIVLCRTLLAYLSIYLLHFSNNHIDKERCHYLLYKVKMLLPSEQYESVMKVTTCKIPFVRIFLKTGSTSYYLFIVLNYIRSRLFK